MTCPACLERGKTWNGSDPKCAFENDTFNPDNWNCATANMIRSVAQIEGHDDISYVWTDDENYATINVDPIGSQVDNALALWVSWYKGRGKTQAMWLLFDNRSPRQPTLEECIAIYNKYSSYI